MDGEITVSVPGKIMLLGEHSVVYGGSCISSVIDKYLTVVLTRSLGQVDEVDSSNLFIVSALRSMRSRYKVPPLSISIASDITGYGLGSSSAVVLGIIKGIASLLSFPLSDKEIFNLSLSAVLSVQGIASGFDVATSLYGNTIFFSGKTKETRVISHNRLPLSVFFSGKKANTVSFVEKVAKEYKENPGKTEGYFREINGCVEKGKRALINKNWKILGSVMSDNHEILKKLNVSTPLLDQIVETACKNGAYGAKLSGAGGGDCVIVLSEEGKRSDIISSLKGRGVTHLNISVGGNEGVKIITV